MRFQIILIASLAAVGLATPIDNAKELVSRGCPPNPGNACPEGFFQVRFTMLTTLGVDERLLMTSSQCFGQCIQCGAVCNWPRSESPVTRRPQAGLPLTVAQARFI
ncbi:hypothetical protein PUNSTDRAFT_54042 [Punctularia strigosozonata HHB-11173 SS5]|uniref:uncharacterized protein n=1 Tax=Punctularia strigosozonata (strain HHB-11173) TaxID=741275 RepID=UPI0004417644|nr:uncharacterized protein PUNSTDRAFT_54042 [Punctularia strigosozonata HHB-11173 SS5]EIN06634.1 hypothetical protein PUNSTDRAFT_54042 [Punctularia strigosozonata HHB-11173 SS5]